jgi:hypothetical protein
MWLAQALPLPLAGALVAMVITASAALSQSVPDDCTFSLADVSEPVPQFATFPAPVDAQRAPAPVVLSSAEARRYRTMLREGAAKGPNFAGHYTIVEWGCGSACVDWAIVDARSGRVFFFKMLRAVSGAHVDFGKSADTADDDLLRYRRDSKLLIILGAPNEDEKREGIGFYRWDHDRLDQLSFVPRAKLCLRHQ